MLMIIDICVYFKKIGRRVSTAITTSVFLRLLKFCSTFWMWFSRIVCVWLFHGSADIVKYSVLVFPDSSSSHQRAPDTPPLCSEVWPKESGSTSAAVFRGILGSHDEEYRWFRHAAYCWKAWSRRTQENLGRVCGKFFPLFIYLQLVLDVRI